METEYIPIRVDAETARTFKSASAEKRRKLEILLSIRLSEAIRANSSLKQTMTQISRKAQQRGLTPKILRTILDEA